MQSAYCQASDGGVEGVRPPRAFSHRFFAQKSGVAEGRRLRDPAAERQRLQGAVQIESRKKRGRAAPMHSHTVAES